MTQPRCRDCGQFIVSEFVESPFCDTCLDARWDLFMDGVETEREVRA